MATLRFPIESVSRQLATLKPTIEALLKCNSPTAPIVKEKIEQAEKIICTIPIELDFESVAKSWHKKLAVWWVEFAIQQNQTPLLLPNEVELMMITPHSSPFSRFWQPKEFDLPFMPSQITVKPSPISKTKYLPQPDLEVPSSTILNNRPITVSKTEVKPSQQIPTNKFQRSSTTKSLETSSISHEESISANSVPEKVKVVPPYTSVRPMTVVAERESTYKPVPDNFDWGSAQAAPAPSAVASKERRSSDSSLRIETASAATNAPTPANTVPVPIVSSELGKAASAMTAPEPVFQRLPDDFDWGSGPGIPKQPRPPRRDSTKKSTTQPGQDCEWD